MTSFLSKYGKALFWVGFLVFALVFLKLQPPLTGFTLGSHHDFLSGHGLAVSAGTSLAKPFQMYDGRYLSDSDTLVYSRFPFWPFYLTEAVSSAMSDNLADKIKWSRRQMALWYLLAALFCFLAMAYVLKDQLQAAVATAMAFTSHYILFYHEMIFNDVPALFGCTLVFWAFVRPKDKRTNLTRILAILASLSLGWQPLTVLVSFLVYEAFLLKGEGGWGFKHMLIGLGVAGLTVAGNLMANLVAESYMVGVPFTELPTVKSMLMRFGFDESFNQAQAATLGWPQFLQTQLTYIGRSALPKSVGGVSAYLGAGIFVLAAGFLLVRQTALALFPLFVGGLIWHFGLRNFTGIHDFQAMFYVGIPLIVAAALIRGAGLLPKPKWAVGVILVLGLGLAAKAVKHDFYSKAKMGATGSRMTADFMEIKKHLNPGSAVFMTKDGFKKIRARHLAAFYLHPALQSSVARADYVIDVKRPNLESLTPGNNFFFLYTK